VLTGGEGNEKLHLADILHDDSVGPSSEVEIREMKRMLAVSIARLPERERLVIALYYFNGMTFKEIGKILTISESRVYQLHTQAVIRLRGYLQRDSALFH
jgi:RNA polymerase sigma factor for flagellar operon FliA